MFLPNFFSFRLLRREDLDGILLPAAKHDLVPSTSSAPKKRASPAVPLDHGKRTFLKMAAVAGLGVVASQVLPKQASAYVMGSAPTSAVVGVKNSSNTRINPATEESLQELVTGQEVTKHTANLSASGTVHTPSSGKKLRVYSTRFSMTADLTSVSFRFTSGGSDHELYLAPKTGGLYGSNNHPNFVEGGADEPLYCVITGSANVQINIDYLEV
jgi:hypothetical protein